MFNADGFKVIKGLTDAIMQRQEVLSGNLANIETKNYVRQDIDFSRVLGDLKNNSMNVAEDDNQSMLARSRYRDYSKPMTMESELSKLYENHLRYLHIWKPRL